MLISLIRPYFRDKGETKDDNLPSKELQKAFNYAYIFDKLIFQG